MSTKKKVTKKKTVKKKSAVKKKKTVAKKGPAKSKKKSTPKKSVKKPKAKLKSKTKPKAKVKSKAKVKTKSTSKSKTKTVSKVKAKSKAVKPKKSSAKSAPSKEKVETQKVTAKPQIPVKLDKATLKIRARLVENREELLRLLESSQALERNVGELNFSNEIDLASSLEGREMGFQLSSRDRNELRLIDEALLRMQNGTYGICDSCEKKISAKRLQILPLTPLCIECQESLEH